MFYNKYVMNNIQEKLLNIAKLFTFICDELNLRYFAIGGTCLGAVRHSGFIPWDDDIDFAMPRSDYNKFLSLSQGMLPKNYFLQTHASDKNYYCPFAKLRDSSTTAIENGDKNIFINHGLWIDIFPLDGLPKSFKKRKQLEFIEEYFCRRRMLTYRYKNLSFKGKIANFASVVVFPSKERAYNFSLKRALMYPFENSEYVWWNWNSRIKKNFLRSWFDSCIKFPFEDIFVNVPINYEDYLTEHYGNWKEYPPEEQRKAIHNLYIVDLEKPYLDYYENKKLKALKTKH